MVGQRLSDHPDIRKLGFTGSTPIGKQIMKRYDLTNSLLISSCNSWVKQLHALSPPPPEFPVAAVPSVTWRRFLWSWAGSRLSSSSVTVTWTRLFAWWESKTDTQRQRVGAYRRIIRLLLHHGSAEVSEPDFGEKKPLQKNSSSQCSYPNFR